MTKQDEIAASLRYVESIFRLPSIAACMHVCVCTGFRESERHSPPSQPHEYPSIPLNHTSQAIPKQISIRIPTPFNTKNPHQPKNTLPSPLPTTPFVRLALLTYRVSVVRCCCPAATAGANAARVFRFRRETPTGVFVVVVLWFGMGE